MKRYINEEYPGCGVTADEVAGMFRQENKNKSAFEIIKDKFDIVVFEYKDLDGNIDYRITIKPKKNKISNYYSNFITKEEFEIIKYELNSAEEKPDPIIEVRTFGNIKLRGPESKVDTVLLKLLRMSWDELPEADTEGIDIIPCEGFFYDEEN